jgi:hypothetical protein
MTDQDQAHTNGDRPLSAERRNLLRAASALAAGTALFDKARAQQASPAAAAPLSIPGFTPARIEVGGGVTINAVKGGNGPPLLLLHGAPLTLYT